MNEEVKNTTNQMKANIGKPTTLVCSFDTTGSMQPAIAQVRQKLRDLVEMMTADLPDLKIGLISHGDYCDGDNCISVLEPTNDLEKLMNFITNTPNTSGGDAPECYEFALQTARQMPWPKEGGSVILIGDDEPHEVNPNNIDWRDEIRQLREKNVKVFPLQCLYSTSRYGKANEFWKSVAEISGTPLLMLESFADSSNTIEAVAYAASGTASYNFYTSKFASEVASGMRFCASPNLADNQVKLDFYAKNSE